MCATRRNALYLTAKDDTARGYTLIELVAVIVILGVVAAIAGPKFFGENIFKVRGYADEIATGLRYAQKVAVASGCPVQFVAAPSSGYTLMQRAAVANHCASSGAWSLPVLRPDGNDYIGTPPTGADVAGNATFTFDSSGTVTPSAGSVLQVIGASATFNLTVDTTTGLVVVEKAS